MKDSKDSKISRKIIVREFTKNDVKDIQRIFLVCTRNVLRNGIRSIVFKSKILSYGLISITSIVTYNNVSAGLLLGISLYCLPVIFGYLLSYLHYFLDKDLNDLENYYNKKSSALFIVEVDIVIAGMVGISPANINKKGHHKGFRKVGDAEMSRMNVLEEFRGLGLSRLLFNKVIEFCSQEKEYKRIILTTSNFQEVACSILYPKLGFSPEHEVIQFPIRLVFFSKVIAN